MNIEQCDKTLSYILENLDKEDLHFLRYQEFPSKNNKTMIRRFDSTSLENLTIVEIREKIQDDSILLIKILPII